LFSDDLLDACFDVVHLTLQGSIRQKVRAF
jgi:hypothetical protein